ncbi:hypothetical protein [Micromonospora sp. DT227]|uniref:hypothetical protein n=1 Tax=Micromonospora sp. DT227 TaxID=3393433 RepID=UPI003CF78721
MSPGDRLALDVLCAVDHHVNECGVPPTVRQLAVVLRRRSWAPVQRQVSRLIRDSLLLPVSPAGVLRPTQTPWRTPGGQVCVRRPPRRRPVRRCYGTGSLTDVDEVAVERALDGDGTRPLSIAEKIVAVRLGVALRWNDREIADRIGVSARHVLRIRQQNGIGSGVPLGTNQHSPRHAGWGLVA